MAAKRNDDAHTPNGPESLNAFLDQGSSFEGKLTFQGSVRIDGRFDGDVLSDDTLMVGETGTVEGTVEVGDAVISGTVKGTLTVRNRLHFRATAVFEGDVTAGTLEVEDGATLDGTVRMRGASGKRDSRDLERAVESTLGSGEKQKADKENEKAGADAKQ